MDTLIDFDFNNVSYDEIIGSILINLNKCLKDNDEILDEDNSKGHNGFNLMKYGVISTQYLSYM